MSLEEVQTLIASYYQSCDPPDDCYATDDSERIESFFGCVLPPVFRAFRLVLPHFHVEGDHLTPAEMAAVYEWETKHNPNFTRDHLPFYSVGNGDQICLSISACPDSPVLYVAHDDLIVSILASSFGSFLKDTDWFCRP